MREKMAGIGNSSRKLRVQSLTWLRGTQKCLKRDEGGSDGQGRSPLIFQDVKADGACLGADVWVPDLGVKLHLRTSKVG